MKAKDLIKMLEQDPEAEVIINGIDGYEVPVSMELEHSDVRHFKVGENCDIDYSNVCTSEYITNKNFFIFVS